MKTGRTSATAAAAGVRHVASRPAAARPAKAPVPARSRERKERAQARARDEILEAALRAFVASGYRDTKMADIAAEAGYTAASLYTYFASKRDIVLALAEHLVDEIVDAWGPVPDAPPAPPTDFATFATALAARIGGVLAHLDRRAEGIAFFTRMRWTGDPDLQPTSGDAACVTENALDQRIHDRIEKVLGGIGMGQVSTLDPEIVSSTLAGMIETLVLRGVATGTMPRFQEHGERMTSFLLYGIRGSR